MARATKRPTAEVAAFGERSVEAELLRHNWVPANFNDTVRNAADHDIVAKKNGRTLLVSVKTCHKAKMFQFRYFDKKPQENELTVLVEMADDKCRVNDQFYIVPTEWIYREVKARQRLLKKPKLDGQARKDLGMCTLRLKGRRDKKSRAGWNLRKRLEEQGFLGAWDRLDEQ